MYQQILFLLALSLLPCANSNAPSVAATPIHHWDGSWAASSAQGTVVAVSCRIELEEGKSADCVILLTRSSAASTVLSKLRWQPSPSPGSETRTIYSGGDALKITEITSLDDFLVASSEQPRSSWKPMGKTAICAMTGLSSDVDHVTRVVQKQVHNHRYVYDSFRMPVSGIAKWLADTVRSAGKWNGGRPYGLQALLVGTQHEDSLSVFSVDPSGAWRSWGSGATAIGRNAEEIREELYNQLQEEPADMDPVQVLKAALRSVLKAIHAASVNQENDDYDTVLIYTDPSDNSQCLVASVDPVSIKACKDAVWKELSAKQS